MRPPLTKNEHFWLLRVVLLSAAGGLATSLIPTLPTSVGLFFLQAFVRWPVFFIVVLLAETYRLKLETEQLEADIKIMEAEIKVARMRALSPILPGAFRIDDTRSWS